MNKITFDQIQLFMSLFKGRNDIYAKRWEKDGRNGYSPAYEVDWTEYRAFKTKVVSSVISQIKNHSFLQPKLFRVT